MTNYEGDSTVTALLLVACFLFGVGCLWLCRLGRTRRVGDRPWSELQLATREQLVAELTRRPDFAGVLVVPKATYHHGRAFCVETVNASIHGMDLPEASQCLTIAALGVRMDLDKLRKKGAQEP